MEPLFAIVPGVIFLVWIAVVVYMLLLATRLVNAVEQIARAMTQRLPGSPQ
jgi:hypothetical protein